MEENSAKRDCRSNSMDRISQLPEHLLHHILGFLEQGEAVKTCVLSKAWRHIGCTRPMVKFYDGDFRGRRENIFMSALNKTLQRYHDQKLCVQEFIVELIHASDLDSEYFSLLDKWIPIVLPNMGVEKFSLFLDKDGFYDLPLGVFEAESLQELLLQGCKLDEKKVPDKVLCKNLTTLKLWRAHIQDETFQKIISSCPLIEHIDLVDIEGLRTINMEYHNLKIFDFSNSVDHNNFEIHLPKTVEIIDVDGNANWFHHIEFPNLKSLRMSSSWFNGIRFPELNYLCMDELQLSSKWFDNFSCNFPLLETLVLDSCYGFKEVQLLSHSIKHLKISSHDKSISPAAGIIDAPNILTFEFSGSFPPSIYFATTSTKWKSKISLSLHDDNDSSLWFFILNGLLKGLSESEISLRVDLYCLKNHHIKECPPLQLLELLHSDACALYKPLVVEKFTLGACDSPSIAASFLYGLFYICRPRNIIYYGSFFETCGRQHNEVFEFLCKFLLCRNNQEGTHYFWKQDVKESSLEAFDDYAKVWHPVYGTIKSIKDNCHNFRFRLKWGVASKFHKFELYADH